MYARTFYGHKHSPQQNRVEKGVSILLHRFSTQMYDNVSIILLKNSQMKVKNFKKNKRKNK